MVKQTNSHFAFLKDTNKISEISFFLGFSLEKTTTKTLEIGGLKEEQFCNVLAVHFELLMISAVRLTAFTNFKMGNSLSRHPDELQESVV